MARFVALSVPGYPCLYGALDPSSDSAHGVEEDGSALLA
jgi:hypothetical protein